jgi:hypothetical protein
MNVGDPNNAMRSVAVEGVGYVRSSDDRRKDKTARSQGTLL